MKKIYDEYVEFMNIAKSVYISTVNEFRGGVAPEISYSPCIVDENKNIYILVSTLSKRTASLIAQRNTSLMFIESEEQCEQIYVRTRLIFYCSTLQIAREMGAGHLLWDDLVSRFTAKFGDIINTLVSLDDFKMFRFLPMRGTYIKGFGKAYRIKGIGMKEVEHIKFDAGIEI
jgi:putative heme iron utilization protein